MLEPDDMAEMLEGMAEDLRAGRIESCAVAVVLAEGDGHHVFHHLARGARAPTLTGVIQELGAQVLSDTMGRRRAVHAALRTPDTLDG